MYSFHKSKLKAATYLIACSAGFGITDTYASELDFRLSDKAVHANFTYNDDEAKAKFGLGYLYKEEKSSDVNLVNVDLHAKGQSALANMPASIGVGFEVNTFKANDLKGTAIGLGGTLRLNIPAVAGLSAETSLHYAPSILSYQDTEDFRRFRAQANYRVIENAEVAIGYRYISFEHTDTNKRTDIENGIFLGVQLDL